MPVLGGTSTIRLKDIVQSARAYADLRPVLGASGFEQEPALTIANDTIQKMLAQNFNWKFNRANAPVFYTIALQQDYVSNVTDLSWVEQCWRIDFNNTASPKPVFRMEAVRDLQQTSYQAHPFQLSWIPNGLAILGTWQANTSYPTGVGAASTPASPIQQFLDANGNILYVTTNGTSGSTEPFAPTGSAGGYTVADGTVVWTVADPNGYAFRLGTLPPSSGITWEIHPVYQMKPPKFTSLQNAITPIPDDMAYLFRQGFMAMCYDPGSAQFRDKYSLWQEALFTALRAADRERDFAGFSPSESIMGGQGQYLPIGPAYPYGWSY